MFTLLNTNLASFLTEANTADTPIRLYSGNSELMAQIASGESLTGVIANSQGLLKVYNTPEGKMREYIIEWAIITPAKRSYILRLYRTDQNVLPFKVVSGISCGNQSTNIFILGKSTASSYAIYRDIGDGSPKMLQIINRIRDDNCRLKRSGSMIVHSCEYGNVQYIKEDSSLMLSQRYDPAAMNVTAVYPSENFLYSTVMEKDTIKVCLSPIVSGQMTFICPASAGDMGWDARLYPLEQFKVVVSLSFTRSSSSTRPMMVSILSLQLDKTLYKPAAFPGSLSEATTVSISPLSASFFSSSGNVNQLTVCYFLPIKDSTYFSTLKMASLLFSNSTLNRCAEYASQQPDCMRCQSGYYLNRSNNTNPCIQKSEIAPGYGAKETGVPEVLKCQPQCSDCRDDYTCAKVEPIPRYEARGIRFLRSEGFIEIAFDRPFPSNSLMASLFKVAVFQDNVYCSKCLGSTHEVIKIGKSSILLETSFQEDLVDASIRVTPLHANLLVSDATDIDSRRLLQEDTSVSEETVIQEPKSTTLFVEGVNYDSSSSYHSLIGVFLTIGVFFKGFNIICLRGFLWKLGTIETSLLQLTLSNISLLRLLDTPYLKFADEFQETIADNTWIGIFPRSITSESQFFRCSLSQQIKDKGGDCSILAMYSSNLISLVLLLVAWLIFAKIRARYQNLKRFHYLGSMTEYFMMTGSILPFIFCTIQEGLTYSLTTIIRFHASPLMTVSLITSLVVIIFYSLIVYIILRSTPIKSSPYSLPNSVIAVELIRQVISSLAIQTSGPLQPVSIIIVNVVALVGFWKVQVLQMMWIVALYPAVYAGLSLLAVSPAASLFIALMLILCSIIALTVSCLIVLIRILPKLMPRLAANENGIEDLRQQNQHMEIPLETMAAIPLKRFEPSKLNLQSAEKENAQQKLEF